jgi:mRNA-degrading endonuclease YafQ of YafQ-DinJ toxin-antitoxin module
MSLEKWAIVKSAIFDESLARMKITFHDLSEKLDKFTQTKISDPIWRKYGKHDRRLTGKLTGLHHCHLRDDAVLIYRLGQKCIMLICILPHSEIEGRRLALTADRLSKYKI